MLWIKTFLQYLEQIHRDGHTGLQQTCGKNKLTLGETKL